MALLLPNQKVTFQFGSRGNKWETHLGRLTIVLNLETGALFSIYHLEKWVDVPLIKHLWIVLGGPFTSLFFTILFGNLGWMYNWSDPWIGFTVINLYNLVNTSLPWNHPKWEGVQGGIPNDGRQVLDLIKT